MRLAIALVVLTQTAARVPVPIAAARIQNVGTSVRVTGTVIVPSSAFKASSGDEGFAIHDQTGGIWISETTKRGLRIGQLVEVAGILGKNAEKLQIVASEVVVRGGVLRVATGQIGAATLGHLVTVEGTIKRIVDDSPYGYKVFIDDGSGEVQIFFNASTDIDPKARYVAVGRRIRVTGFGSQYETTYEVEPRSRRDVIAVR